MTTALNVLITETAGYSQAALQEYARIGKVVLGRPEREWVLENAAQAHVIVVRLGLLVDEELLDAAPRLLVVATPTTGLNHVDEAACTERGITVVSLRGETAFLDRITATAEHTFGLVLALVRGTVRAHQHVLSGGWDRDAFRGRDLRSLTMGIIGLGRVGRQVAGYARAFGMGVLAHDRRPDLPSEIPHVDLDDLLSRSDIVSLHASFSPENVDLLGARELGLMRAGSYLVNTSRGELVDEAVLAAAVERGHLAGAAVDVLSNEHDRGRLSSSSLVNLARSGANVLITPHIGGCTLDSMKETEVFIAQKVKTFCDTLQAAR